MSPRFLRLDTYDRFVKGTQYEGRVGFYATRDTPLLERAPNVRDPVVKKAIKSHADMVLGEWRWPTITSASPEDEVDGDDTDAGEGDEPAAAKTETDESALTEDESALLDSFIETA